MAEKISQSLLVLTHRRGCRPHFLDLRHLTKCSKQCHTFTVPLGFYLRPWHLGWIQTFVRNNAKAMGKCVRQDSENCDQPGTHNHDVVKITHIVLRCVANRRWKRKAERWMMSKSTSNPLTVTTLTPGRWLTYTFCLFTSLAHTWCPPSRCTSEESVAMESTKSIPICQSSRIRT